MATKKQIEANRRNAKKSRGPVTPLGRAAVAQNAQKHGLCGRFRVLEGEEQEAFDLFNGLMRDEKPVGTAEVQLIRNMAEHYWQSQRASRCQEGCFLVERTPEQIANHEAEFRINPLLERSCATSLITSAPISAPLTSSNAAEKKDT